MTNLTTFTRILLAGFLLVQAEARASVVLEFDNGTAASDSVTIQPGSAFSFGVYLTSTAEQTVGLSYFLAESTVGNPANPGSGMFTITGRGVSGSPYSELQTGNTAFLSAANAVLDPRNNNDAGGIEPSLEAQSAGTYFVANFTIQSSALTAVGTYEITFADAVYIDEVFEPHSFNTLGTYTVTVVPEPGSFALVSVAGVLVLGRRVRRQIRR